MSLPGLFSTPQDAVTYVHADDPCVKAPDGVTGFVPKDACKCDNGATEFRIKPLSTWDRVAVSMSLSADEDRAGYIRSVIKEGLVSIDGDESKAAAFAESPGEDYVLPLFTAIQDLTDRPTVGPDSE